MRRFLEPEVSVQIDLPPQDCNDSNVAMLRMMMSPLLFFVPQIIHNDDKAATCRCNCGVMYTYWWKFILGAKEAMYRVAAPKVRDLTET